MITQGGGIGAYRSLHALRRSRTGSAHLVLSEQLFAWDNTRRDIDHPKWVILTETV